MFPVICSIFPEFEMIICFLRGAAFLLLIKSNGNKRKPKIKRQYEQTISNERK